MVTRVVLFVLLSSLPAWACVPIPMATSGAVVLAWLVWVVLSLLAPFLGGFQQQRGNFAYAPLGLFFLAAPAVGALTLPLYLIFLSFPMAMAVDFFSAYFTPQRSPERRWNMLVAGVPLAVVLIGGIAIKIMVYNQNGVGLRTLYWNYFENRGTWMFFIIAMGAGCSVLSTHLKQPRDPGASGNGDAQEG